jgi:energy-coupling factor transporter ATP-binding protein EcfA2
MKTIDNKSNGTRGFWTTGSVRSDQNVVVERFQEAHILASLRRSPVTLVIGPRQSGKSTLLKKIAAEDTTGKVVYVSLEQFSGKDKGWLQQHFWEEITELVCKEVTMEPTPEMRKKPWNFFSMLGGKYTLLVDEFTSVGMRFSDLFHTIRSVIEMDRYNSPTFLLADRSHPTQYMDGASSPFNIVPQSSTMYLQDFTEAEVTVLLERGFESSTVEGEQGVGESVYGRTRGQPYLTQRLGQLLVDVAKEQSKNNVTIKDVRTVEAYLMEGAIAGQDVHFTTLLNYIVSEATEGAIFGRNEKRYLKDILRGTQTSFSLHHEVGHLYALGFIRPTNSWESGGGVVMSGNCKIRNPMYGAFLRHNERALRPI